MTKLDAMRMRLRNGLLLLLGTTTGVSAFVNEGPGEFSATGDFNGDGAPDFLIVDRATGAFRIGYNTGVGAYTWAEPRASGVEHVDSVSVGRLLQTTRDSVAIASVIANRVNLFDVPTASGAAVPSSVFTPGIGPNFAVAINLPGGGDTAHADLVIGTSQNNAPNTGRYALVRNNAGATTLLLEANYPLLSSGNRLSLKTAGPEFLGAIANVGATAELRIFSPNSGSLNQVVAVAGLQPGTRFSVGNFSGGTFSHVLTWLPGQSSFLSHAATEPLPATYALSAGTSYDLGSPVSQLVTLPGATTGRLLAIFNDGTARVYEFNGASAPTLVQEITPDAGERVTSVLPTGNNEFVAFSGTGNVSKSSRAYTKSGNGYTAGLRVALPAITPLSAGANVFLFQGEPFVSTNPGLLRSVNAGDWTSDLSIVPGAPATFVADVWNYDGETAGLRNPTSVNFGAVAPSTSFGLVNQYANFISIFSRAPALGNEVVEIKIAPAPGEHKVAINVALSTTLPGAQLYYRTASNSSWTLYSAPFPLFKSTTVQYYGVPAASTAKSRIHTAEYTFPTPPSTQDSDRDGIPDYVELAEGLNPNGGTDEDGDGFTDLNELVAGTDPTSALDFPTDAERLEEKAAFDLLVGLQPLNGITSAPTNAVIGIGARVYDLSGSVLRAQTTRNLGLAEVTDPAFSFTNVVLSGEPPLIVVGTDPHYDIATTSADKRLGRELVGFFEAPRAAIPDVPYSYTGGLLTTEANAWIAAAQALFASLPREEVTENLDVNDTLAALLFERKVSQILLERGNPAASNLTLFPFRSPDAGRTNPSVSLLSSLEARIDDTRPGYKLSAVHSSLTELITASMPAGMNHLKALTADIYRISSISNNAAPTKYPSPINVLRDFLETGVLHTNYASARNLSIDLAGAHNAALAALSNLSERPTATLELVVRPDTFSGGCTILDTDANPGTQVALVHPGGTQYRLLESFHLVPGTRIQVFGYTDVQAPGCSTATAIEVIALALDAVPAVSPVDTDGDLLLDSLELLLFGNLGANGNGDSDGDGYSNLQEFLDGTDPSDGAAHGVTIVNLTSPSLNLSQIEGGAIVLTFDWPAAYIENFAFTLQSTSDLGTLFTTQAVTPQSIGPNQYQIVLPNPGTSHMFYLMRLQIQ
jgi:hypothetical protein